MDEKIIPLPDDIDGISLPDEFLEGIAGGALTDYQKMVLDMYIDLYKRSGKSLDDMIASNHQMAEGIPDPVQGNPDRRVGIIPEETVAEMDEYVRQHW